MELGGPWAFMIGDGLSVFAIIEVSDIPVAGNVRQGVE
jgi:hypothetical protein